MKKCKYCGSEIRYTVMGEYCSNKDCGYIDGHYWPVKQEDKYPMHGPCCQ